MSQKGNQHVVRTGSGWAVRQAGSSRLTAIFPTQRQAIAKAEVIAKAQGVDTKVHGRDGKIRSGNSYGNDPFPPRDKR